MKYSVIIVLFVALLFSCENLQLPHEYVTVKSPCGDTVDTSSKFALLEVYPSFNVSVVTGSQQQFWIRVSDLNCTAVQYTLSKPLGSITDDGLYTAPSSITGSSDTVYLTVQSQVKKSLIVTFPIAINKWQSSACDVLKVTYSGDVDTLMNNYCLSCHSTDQYVRRGGNVNLEGYDNVKQWKDRVLSTIDYKGAFKMPRESNKLDSCSINKVKAWIAKGAPND